MTATNRAAVRVRPLVPSDRARWDALYAGYLDHYGLPVTQERLDVVWSWLHDPEHPLEGLVALDGEAEVVGLAHCRAFPRPSTGSVGGFLDDLFVDPRARGTGAADALLAALRGRGAQRGWSVVRWITAQDNARAQAVYDRHATRTTWVTYDMAPDPAPAPPPHASGGPRPGA